MSMDNETIVVRRSGALESKMDDKWEDAAQESLVPYWSTTSASFQMPCIDWSSDIRRWKVARTWLVNKAT